MSRGICHIVDDDTGVSESTAFLLRTEGFETTIHASGEAFLDNLDGLERGCILLDIRMPGINGLDLQRHLRDRGIDMPVVIITGHGDVDVAVRAMKDGACDFIQKPFSREDLMAAVETAIRQPPRPKAANAEIEQARQAVDTLAPRERQVLEGLVRGHSNKVIAYDLGLSVRTVELYRANSMRKLGVRNLPEMLHLAFLAEVGNGDSARAASAA